MKKKNLFIISILIAILIGGIVSWKLSNQNNHPINNSTIQNLSTNNESQKVEKNLVEFFYLPHSTINPIKKRIESILKKFPEYKLKEYDFYNKNNKQKIKDYNLLGHIPVAIFIKGTNTFLIDGQEIILKNFPKDNVFVPTLEGSWNYDYLEKILSNPDKYQK